MTKTALMVENVSNYIQHKLNVERMENNAAERIAHHKAEGLGNRVIALELMSGAHGCHTLPSWLEEVGYEDAAEMELDDVVNLFDNVAGYLSASLNVLLRPVGTYSVEQSFMDGSIQVMYTEE